MTKSITVHCLSCFLMLGAYAATAQDVAEGDFDYDAAIEDLPIESEAYAPATTFTNGR